MYGILTPLVYGTEFNGIFFKFVPFRRPHGEYFRWREVVLITIQCSDDRNIDCILIQTTVKLVHDLVSKSTRDTFKYCKCELNTC